VPTVADIFRQAAQFNRRDPRRKGNVVFLGDDAEIVISGDIHGHRGNLARILDYADLPRHADRVLVLQELIHGPMDDCTGLDRSVELLMRAARLKLVCPNLLFVLGNHDLAQVTGNEITKEGRGVCKAFSQGLAESFGPRAAEVCEAVNDFLLSIPLAVRIGDAVLVTHSLPSPQRMQQAGTDILSAEGYNDRDVRRGGGAYEWTWGRNQTPEQLADLSAKVGARFFVLGHRHSGMGYELIPDRGISLACDNDRACILHLPPHTALTLENVLTYLKPVVTIGKS
jgi:hypothetical protein